MKDNNEQEKNTKEGEQSQLLDMHIKCVCLLPGSSSEPQTV